MMPSQRRPPPPPPPDDDSPPPPLPTRSGPTSLNSQRTSNFAPPPLPSRTQQNGLGPKDQQRPASPQFQEEYLLPSDAPQLPSPGSKTPDEDLYLLPDQPEEPQETYEVIGSVAPAAQDAKVPKDDYEEMSAPPPVPFKPQVQVPKVQVVPLSTAKPPQLPLKPKLPQVEEEDNLIYEEPEASPAPAVTSASPRRGEDGCFSGDDDDGWGSDFDEDAPPTARDDMNGGDASPDADMYLTPEGGDIINEAPTMDDTYEAPEPVQKPVLSRPAVPKTAVQKPVIADRSTLPRDSQSQPLQGIMDRVKMFQQRSDTKDTTPGPPRKAAWTPKPKFPNPPNVSPKALTPGGAKLPTAIVQPYVPPVVPKPAQATSRPAPNPRPPKQNDAPSLPPKPSTNNPPALPPNHPTRDSDDGGSAGSVSSGSGGVVDNAFRAGLNKVIGTKVVGMSMPIPRNAPQNQETVAIAKAPVSDDIYAEGISEDVEPLAAYPWFHSDVTKENKLGNERVMQVGLDGTYLVRKSSSKDSYVLIVYYGKKAWSLPISLRADGKYAIGEEKADEKRFDSVPDFIEHHQKYNINLKTGGMVTLVKHAPRPR